MVGVRGVCRLLKVLCRMPWDTSWISGSTTCTSQQNIARFFSTSKKSLSVSFRFWITLRIFSTPLDWTQLSHKCTLSWKLRLEDWSYLLQSQHFILSNVEQNYYCQMEHRQKEGGGLLTRRTSPPSNIPPPLSRLSHKKKGKAKWKIPWELPTEKKM